MQIFSGTFTALEKGLNYSALKQKTISNNIANADTPNYKAKDVSFKKVFADTLHDTITAHRTDARHFAFKGTGGEGAVVTQKNQSFNQNGNGVDIDKEMSSLAQNQIYFNALADRMAGKFNSLTNVIKGGK
ncbi:flagellar basal body rod protein FlgB [Bacillus xiapuensis]|uniref:flagellar basal body rod protein FlgB n=1 Tax=Bacillus xiapuensis TaxID=2014075 RepID=UPI000C23B6A5|nr:flagellar basal body rod protein FlgB [Bacillus xiapuensis]